MTTMQDGQTHLDIAIADELVEFTGEGRNQRIHYIAANHSERWSDPEEKVRAELWAELIYKYDYPPERIAFEVNVPRRTPNDYADLVIYRDDELKSPWFVFECKRADVSDAAFNQSIEQACGNRASLGAQFCGAVAGRTRRLLRFDRFPAQERDRNHLTDIPLNYGAPPPWRFYKNKRGQDLSAVPREELRAAIRKCHQTLWEGGRRSPIAAFGEFSKLVFLKHLDEKNDDIKDGEPYEFQRRDGETAEQLAERIERLYAIHAETGLSLAELAIRFLLRDRRFASVIPGAASIEQIEENVRCATAGPLPDELHARLDALGRVYEPEARPKG